MTAAKEEIAVLASAILEQPEHNVAKFADLVLIARTKQRRVGSAIKNIALTAIATVFKDLIPSFVQWPGVGDG